jgi:hypothetical protein
MRSCLSLWLLYWLVCLFTAGHYDLCDCGSPCGIYAGDFAGHGLIKNPQTLKALEIALGLFLCLGYIYLYVKHSIAV